MNRSVLCSAEGSEAEDAWVRCRHFHRHRLNCCSLLFQEHTVGDGGGGNSSPATGPRDKPRRILGDYKRTKQSCWYKVSEVGKTKFGLTQNQFITFNQRSLSQILRQSDFAFQASSVQFFICPLNAIFTHSIWKAESKSFTPPMSPSPTIPWSGFTVLICFSPYLLSVPPMSLFPPNFGFIERYDLPTACSHPPPIIIYMFEAFLPLSLAPCLIFNENKWIKSPN